MIRLSEYLTAERVAIIEPTTKAEAIEKLVDLLVESDGGADRDALLEAIWKREEMMSTGIGHGLAVPHVRLAGLKAATMVVGVCRDGITDYDSLDGKAVQIVILIAAPSGQHEVYIRLLAQVAEVLKQEARRAAIVAAENPQEIYRILTEAK